MSVVSVDSPDESHHVSCCLLTALMSPKDTQRELRDSLVARALTIPVSRVPAIKSCLLSSHGAMFRKEHGTASAKELGEPRGYQQVVLVSLSLCLLLRLLGTS